MHLLDLLLGVLGLSVGITALVAMALETRDIGRIADILLDAASLVTIALLAVAGAAILGVRLAETTHLPYIDHAPLAVFALIGLRFAIQVRNRRDQNPGIPD